MYIVAKVYLLCCFILWILGLADIVALNSQHHLARCVLLRASLGAVRHRGAKDGIRCGRFSHEIDP